MILLSKHGHILPTWRQRVRGQALLVVALVLPVLLLLALTCVEVAARYEALAEVQDALTQASRSAVQTFDYRAFASGAARGRATSATTMSGCAGLTPASARAVACQAFISNLSGMRRLRETPAQTAARAQWTVLPQGGTCTFPNGRVAVTFATPAICATLRPQLGALILGGDWSPQIDAAETLDPIP